MARKSESGPRSRASTTRFSSSTETIPSDAHRSVRRSRARLRCLLNPGRSLSVPDSLLELFLALDVLKQVPIGRGQRIGGDFLIGPGESLRIGERRLDLQDVIGDPSY